MKSIGHCQHRHSDACRAVGVHENFLVHLVLTVKQACIACSTVINTSSATALFLLEALLIPITFCLISISSSSGDPCHSSKAIIPYINSLIGCLINYSVMRNWLYSPIMSSPLPIHMKSICLIFFVFAT